MIREYDLFSALPAAPQPARDPWHAQARRIAKRHAARDNWLGTRWSCCCGACRQARRDGFIPRESIARYR
jgi:hypothetical protein